MLLLSFGWAHVGLRNAGVVPVSHSSEETNDFKWPPMSRFVRQKRRAMKRAAIIAAAGGLVFVAGLVSLLFG